MCRILEPANPEPVLVQPPAPVVSQPASPPRPAAAAPAPAAPTTPTGSLTDIAAESAVTPPRYRKHKSAIAAFREAGGGLYWKLKPNILHFPTFWNPGGKNDIKMLSVPGPAMKTEVQEQTDRL